MNDLGPTGLHLRSEDELLLAWANDWFYLRTKERWQDRLRYLRHSTGWFFLPSQKDKQWISWPKRLH
jgi:hypothetical protein